MATFRASRVAVVGTVLAVAGCAASEPPRVAAFDQAATTTDVVPDGLDVAGTYEEIRYVGEAGETAVYAAKAATGDPWCVLVVFTEGTEDDRSMMGSSCADDVTFRERGVWASVGGETGELGRALLLPDDFTGDLDDTEWQRAKPNLAVSAQP